MIKPITWSLDIEYIKLMYRDILIKKCLFSTLCGFYQVTQWSLALDDSAEPRQLLHGYGMVKVRERLWLRLKGNFALSTISLFIRVKGYGVKNACRCCRCFLGSQGASSRCRSKTQLPCSRLYWKVATFPTAKMFWLTRIFRRFYLCQNIRPKKCSRCHKHWGIYCLIWLHLPSALIGRLYKTWRIVPLGLWWDANSV